jgi:hypothetical protein
MAAFNPYTFRNGRSSTAFCGNAESQSNFLNARAGIVTSFIIVQAPLIVL